MLKSLIAMTFIFTGTMAMADTFEIGWDRPGNDYFHYEMNNPREILCQNRCQQDRRCRAWTYVNKGVQGPRAQCWLKHTVPAPIRNSCCTSGIIN